MSQPSGARGEIALSAAIIAACGLVLLESRGIPATPFDSLGSAMVPQVTAGVVLLLSLGLLGTAAWRARPQAGEPVRWARWLDATVVMALSAGLVVAMQAELLAFGWLSAAFLVLTIGWLERVRPARLPMLVALALAIGFGCQYVFTRIFIVNLPGL